MNTRARVGLYAAALAAVFGTSAVVAGAVAPQDSVRAPAASDRVQEQSSEGGAAGQPSDAQQPSAAPQPTDEGAVMVSGLSLEQDGYVLGEVRAPDEVGSEGELAFTVTRDGSAVTDFAVEHDKRLHLIVVRSDGSHFRHVHPEMDADGRWSIPWTWEAAGTYRVFADFAPTGGEGLTLTRAVDVAGDVRPTRSTAVSTTSSVDGFDVTLEGELQAGAASPLTLEVLRDGEPVTTLESYLGAFGHLVALREGDLAYLHVHPLGAEPAAGQLSGPTIAFNAETPTPGRYLLYLDFQVDGQVHTATFAVDAAAAPGTKEPADRESDGETPDDDSGHGGADHGH